VCLSQARTCISNVICRGLYVFSEIIKEVTVCFVDICEIDDHHRIKFFYIYTPSIRHHLYPCYSRHQWHPNYLDIFYRRHWYFQLEHRCNLENWLLWTALTIENEKCLCTIFSWKCDVKEITRRRKSTIGRCLNYFLSVPLIFSTGI
jgi:hypothetical protein